MTSPTSDCCASPGQKLLSVEQGRERILQAVTTVAAREQLHLRAAMGRILASPVASTVDVPPFDNSAMDGYAVRSEDCVGSTRVELTVTGSSFAGTPFAGTVTAGQCVRIMTGAVIPDGTDTVIMQEHVERHDDSISFDMETVTTGQHVRYTGRYP